MYSPITRWDKRKTRFLDGYVLIWAPEHPKSFKGWYYEHRLVYEKFIGGILDSKETVHHINLDKRDNRMLNLFVCTEAEHRKAHMLD